MIRKETFLCASLPFLLPKCIEGPALELSESEKKNLSRLFFGIKVRPVNFLPTISRKSVWKKRERYAWHFGLGYAYSFSIGYIFYLFVCLVGWLVGWLADWLVG
jgi:hypothetical protein